MPKNNDTLFCFRCYHNWKKRKIKNPLTCPKCNSPYWNKARKKIPKEIILKMKDMIVNIHEAIIKLSGGENGIRDEGGIYNSIYKLLNHQAKNQCNPSSIGAFALNEFARRHFFNDGNKRTAYAICKVFMLINRCHLKIQYQEATNFIIEVAKYNSKISFEEIKKWLDLNCLTIPEKEVENYLSKNFVNLMLGDKGDKDER